MNGRVKVLSVRRGWFSDRIRIVTLGECAVRYDSMKGPRKFYLSENYKITVKVSKDLMVVSGEELDFDDVCTPANAFSSIGNGVIKVINKKRSRKKLIISDK